MSYSPQTPTNDEEDLCPNCGKWSILNEATGFCEDCTAESGGFRYCSRCGVNPAQANHTRCNFCRTETFLAANADTLEQLLLEGLSLKTAIKVARNWNRPRCISCGDRIVGGRKTDVLCQQNVQCIQAARRLRTLKDHFQRNKYADPAQTALDQLKLELGYD